MKKLKLLLLLAVGVFAFGLLFSPFDLGDPAAGFGLALRLVGLSFCASVFLRVYGAGTQWGDAGALAMNITPAALDAIFINFDLRYQAAFKGTQAYWDRMAVQVPSSTRQSNYGWIGRIPRMREWIGERVLNNVAAREYTIVNKDFELTIELDRNTIEDDQIGLYNQSVDMLGYQAKLWPDQLVVDLMQQGHLASGAVTYDGVGFSTLTFDNQPFFNANHPRDVNNNASPVFQNYWSTGQGLGFTSFNLVRATMFGYQTEDGRPMGVIPNLLVVPPLLEVVGRQILQQTFIAPAVALGAGAANTVQGNPLQGMADSFAHPYLAGQDTTWYLLATQMPIKPFVFQLRKAPQFAYLNNPTDQNLFMRKKFIYGVDSRGNAGYGLWFLAAKALA